MYRVTYRVIFHIQAYSTVRVTRYIIFYSDVYDIKYICILYVVEIVQQCVSISFDRSVSFHLAKN